MKRQQLIVDQINKIFYYCAEFNKNNNRIEPEEVFYITSSMEHYYVFVDLKYDFIR